MISHDSLSNYQPKILGSKDPMSHRIIEKRRRDRMNNCLADLSRLVPTNYLKKGRGRIEKTEIIEMAIKHLKHLQAHPCKDPGSCEVAKATEQDHKRQYRLGYQECMSETVRFMVESEGLFSGDDVCMRLINHLQKHYDKVAGGLCYTQALGMMISEESKATVQMEVDNHSSSCFPPENCSNGGMLPDNTHVNNFPYENRSSEVPELKQEVEVNGHNHATHNEMKVSSQLREMLQNPGVPKDPSRCSSRNSNNNVGSAPSPLPQPVPVLVSNQNDMPKNEEGYYKFKNNIKHRFNADLRHHTSSPTDSHLSDRMSLPDEDNNNNKIHLSDSSPLRPCHPGPISDDRLGHPPTLLCNPGSHPGHAFSPYTPNHVASELSVKIPDRTAPIENGALSYGNQHWDSHVETASSCGSNPSPPPNAARSNGSSSGYSTNGENNSGPTKLKPHNGTHSPALSPYSRTPDRMSNRTPSPMQPGVPIFALHPKGTFYIPLTIDSSLLVPYMVGVDDLAPVLHPISICVNLSSHSLKVEKMNGTAMLQYRPQSSFLMEKFQDRYIYAERPMFYPSPTSPARNGCT
ncbi:transcription factor cwo-like [Stegodyphus dumicola]|uniref:transcription factor cwo-like n=1 Tax=Stegodyphus dumicola TaxID=202533 RepID=UPI0015AF7213|nr:transcription factor cwo-like [Stegodyphus dumicola]